MDAKFVIIKKEPTAEQLAVVEEFKDYHYAFIDDGGTMRVTDDEGIGKSYEPYAIVEGMNISGGYPTVEGEHIAVYCDKDLEAEGKIEINGVQFGENIVPARFRHLVNIYTKLKK